MDKPAKSDIPSPTEIPSPKAFEKKLGGMPPLMDAEEIMKMNHPEARTPAPGSFRPSEGAKD